MQGDATISVAFIQSASRQVSSSSSEVAARAWNGRVTSGRLLRVEEMTILNFVIEKKSGRNNIVFINKAKKQTGDL